MTHFVSKSCQGEVCRFVSAKERSLVDPIFGDPNLEISFCNREASHKVAEEIFHDDPNPIRHGLTQYLCCFHFSRVMGQICR